MCMIRVHVLVQGSVVTVLVGGKVMLFRGDWRDKYYAILLQIKLIILSLYGICSVNTLSGF